jgi:hypothetical protein
MHEFSNSFVCTYNVFVKFIDGKSQQGQAFKIPNLLQLHFEREKFCSRKIKIDFFKIKISSL